MLLPFTLLALLAADPAPAARWGLRWTAPADCRQAADVARAVEDRLHRPTFGPDPRFTVDGVVERVNAQWRARLTLVDAQGTVLGNREVTGTDEACASLDGKLTLVIALLIDPLAGPRPPPTQSPAPELPPPPSLPREGLFTDEGRARVTLDADRTGVRLYRVVLEGMAVGPSGSRGAFLGTASVCEAPCGVPVPLADRYFVGGDDIMRSPDFVLPKANDVTVKVKTGNAAAWLWGFTLATLGLTSVIAGVVGIVVGASLRSSQGTSALLPIMGGVTAGGAAMFGLGWWMVAGNTTTVDVQPRG